MKLTAHVQMLRTGQGWPTVFLQIVRWMIKSQL